MIKKSAQIHALKIKLASMSDAKKINALKQLIRQIEKTK
jgi:vesicle coat complex subunit